MGKSRLDLFLASRCGGEAFSKDVPVKCSLEIKLLAVTDTVLIVQELCESRGGRPGLSVLTSLLVSVDVKNY